MDLIPGVFLFFGAIGTVALFGLDIFQNRKPITKEEMNQSIGVTPSKTQQKRKGLLKKVNHG